MSWFSIRDARNASNYRYIRFVGGRILQDTELNALQDSDALRERYAIRSQFREGAVANLKPAISGGNVVLSLEDSNIATALIMVNGAWELIAPQTIALPSPRTSGTDTLYLHWVLWRVTSDGHSTAAPRAWWTTA